MLSISNNKSHFYKLQNLYHFIYNFEACFFFKGPKIILFKMLKSNCLITDFINNFICFGQGKFI